MKAHHYAALAVALFFAGELYVAYISYNSMMSAAYNLGVQVARTRNRS